MTGISRPTRSAKTSIEVVAVTGAMVPIVAFLFITGLRICKFAYVTIVGAATWPFM